MLHQILFTDFSDYFFSCRVLPSALSLSKDFNQKEEEEKEERKEEEGDKGERGTHWKRRRGRERRKYGRTFSNKILFLTF